MFAKTGAIDETTGLRFRDAIKSAVTHSQRFNSYSLPFGRIGMGDTLSGDGLIVGTLKLLVLRFLM
ncbi:hypothetical protein J22TS3_00470 [Paenibacillus sp. J22TS3]|nr:hypothetical protein J22TS3_00470 [Paenibacillus sp. J22TS3]